MSELAAAIGVGRAVVYRLVATLEDRGFAVRGADGRVRLGPGLARLSVSVRPVLVEVARPVLRELADAVGATAHLTVAEGEHAVALAVVEPSWTEFHVSYRVGSRHPLDRGAAGRAILTAREGEGEVSVSVGELQPGAHGMAAPVRGVPGLEASVGVVALAPLAERPVGEAVRRAAAQVSRALAGAG
jgi:DNA-binding IclR family transcriptional regulator